MHVELYTRRELFGYRCTDIVEIVETIRCYEVLCVAMDAAFGWCWLEVCGFGGCVVGVEEWEDGFSGDGEGGVGGG